MTQPFEIDLQIEAPATPEQAWQAITTGRGMDGWFMGTNQIEPREGGRMRTETPAFTSEATVTTWDPPNRFRYETDSEEDGSNMQFEYRIEDRGSGRTGIRWIHTGTLAGPDWEAEYEAMQRGDPAYLFKLGQYLTYFFGRTATPVEAFGPVVEDNEAAWKAFRSGLGLSGPVSVGERVRLTPEGLEPMNGQVDYVAEEFLGVRTDDAMLRFIHGFTGPLMVGHHLYGEGVDQKEAERAWTQWLNSLTT
jgi:uncharacterized protein YndB with AHSA1/START domain